MKKLLLTICLAAVLFSCKDEPKNTLAYNDAAETHKEFYGLWSGDLDPVRSEDDTLYERTKKITIKINRIVNDSVFGQSITGGFQRPLRGILSPKADGEILFTLNEPGTQKYDGRFILSLKDGEMTGIYTSYKKNSDTTPVKELKLTQKQFVYNPKLMLDTEIELIDWDKPQKTEVVYEEGEGEEEEENEEVAENKGQAPDSLDTGEKEVYIENLYRTASEEVFKINASTKRLTEEELKNLRKLDLEIIRNTIFARHGYSFKKNSIRYFFEVNSWYVPVANNVDKDLTQLEKANIVLLKRLEQYATDHYDSFGR